jgi:hypothetical protein
MGCATDCWRRQEVQHSGAVVYAVEYPDTLQMGDSSDDLHRLTDETGGILFDPPGADYSGIISRIEADLRGHYILGFRPEATGSDTQRHSLKLRSSAPERQCALAGNTRAPSLATEGQVFT